MGDSFIQLHRRLESPVYTCGMAARERCQQGEHHRSWCHYCGAFQPAFTRQPCHCTRDSLVDAQLFFRKIIIIRPAVVVIEIAILSCLVIAVHIISLSVVIVAIIIVDIVSFIVGVVVIFVVAVFLLQTHLFVAAKSMTVFQCAHMATTTPDGGAAQPAAGDARPGAEAGAAHQPDGPAMLSRGGRAKKRRARWVAPSEDDSLDHIRMMPQDPNDPRLLGERPVHAPDSRHQK